VTDWAETIGPGDGQYMLLLAQL